MKKNLLLIFGLLGLVSLMAEGGPKRGNLLSMLGMEDEPTCCDMTTCCVGTDTNCCDLNTCCSTSSVCCSPTTTSQDASAITGDKVNNCMVQCKR